MPTIYQEFWRKTFGSDIVAFANVVNKLSLIANITDDDERRQVRDGLMWFNIKDQIHKEDFVRFFTYINGKNVVNFRDELLRTTKILYDIISITPFIDRNTPDQFLTGHTYYVKPFVGGPPVSSKNSDLFVFSFLMGGLIINGDVNVGYNIYKEAYTFSIGRDQFIERDPQKLVRIVETSVGKGHKLVSYRDTPFQKIWTSALGYEVKVPIDIAINGFTNAIINHEMYKRGDEKAVEYLVSWLKRSKNGEYYIIIDIFYDFWVCFMSDDKTTYLGIPAKVIESIFKCKGFVNIYKCRSLPRCYYCITKSTLIPSILTFVYTDEHGGKYKLLLQYSNGNFIFDHIYQFKISDISILVELMVLGMRRTETKTLKIIIPKESVITYSDGKFYFSVDNGPRQELGDIYAAAELFEQIYARCPDPKSIVGKFDTVMYASWNTIDFIPKWFDAMEVNTRYAEDYKNENIIKISEISIFKQQMLNHINKKFGSKVTSFIEKLGNVFVTDITNSLLPYLIYITHKRNIAVIEVNDDETVTISGYGKSGNRIYEKYTINDDNMRKILNLIQNFDKFPDDTISFRLLADFYCVESENFFSGKSEDIADVVRGYVENHYYIGESELGENDDGEEEESGEESEEE